MMESSAARRVTFALGLLLLAAAPASAQTNYFWNAPNGGAGTWDTATQNWSTAAGGPLNYTWTNSGNEIANFGPTGGIVDIQGGGITAFGINFTTTTYQLNGGPLQFAVGGGVIDIGSGDLATINAPIFGSTAPTKTGAGVITLNGPNLYTGVTNVNGGILSLGSNDALGSTGAGNETIVANGGTVRLGGGLTVAEAFTLNGDGLGGVGALDKVGGAASTVSGAITLGAAARIGSTNGTLTITGGITGANTNLTITGGGDTSITTTGMSLGTGSLTKMGTGTLTLGTANAFTGGSLTTGGTVLLNNLSGLGTAGTHTIAPASAADASLLLNAAGTFARTLAVGVLNDTGTGRVVIGSQTGLTGSTVFTAPTLFVRRPFTIQAGASINTTFSFVEFRQEGSTVAHMTISAPTPATATNNRVVFFNPTVANTFGDMTIGDLAGPHALVQFGNSSDSGNIVPDGSVINFFSAPGGGNGGSVLLLAPDVAPTGETLGALHSIVPGAGTITTFDSNALDSVYTLTVGGGTLPVNGTFSGVIMQGANAGNADVALVKIGTGTQILSGNNTYTAGTTVNGGTLLVNGQSGSNSGTGTGAVTVNAGGTFGGTGRAAGAVTVNGSGTIRGGTATVVGTLTLGNGLTMNSGAILGLLITDAGAPSAPTTGGSSIGTIPNPTNNNFIDMQASTSLILDPQTQFFIDGTGTTYNPSNSYSYSIGRVNQNLSSLLINNQAQFSTTGFNDPFLFSITGNGVGVLFLNIQPVPEPATVLAIATGVLGAGGFIRRRLRREQPATQGA